MEPHQIKQIDQRLSQWRARHVDAASLRAAYRQKVLDFTLNSMALAGEPVDRGRVQALLTPRTVNPAARPMRTRQRGGKAQLSNGKTMSHHLVLTVIGDDRPGLVGELSTVISAHQGNWLESSMAQLAGKFAGIVEVGVDEAHAAALNEALGRFAGLKITVESAVARKSALAGPRSGIPGRQSPGRRLKLALVGHDRIGIVREVSQVLAHHAVNVESLETRTSSAPMSAATLFHAVAELTAAPDLDVAALTAELERISNDLMVDITLDETIRA
ncbi:MAG: ACT domain-containing protein [Sulfuritalea sp.]|nr:ACT domain-containing protein [Sulfuritalea sp.]